MGYVTQQRADSAGSASTLPALDDAKRNPLAGIEGLDAQQAALSPDGEGEKDPSKIESDPSAWAQEVHAHWAEWDANGDGALTLEEIKAAIDKSKDDNCALAALITLGAYSQVIESLQTGDAPQGVEGVTLEDVAIYEKHFGDPKAAAEAGVANVDGYFHSFKESADGYDEGAFDADGPDWNAVSQGQIGDCYFLAPMIALAKQRPDDLQNLIVLKTKGDESTPDVYTVTFPGHDPVEVSIQKDMMIRKGQVLTHDDGYWATILEQAYANLENKGKRKDEAGEYKKITGGMSAWGIELLTGHEAKNVRCKGRKKDEIHAMLLGAMESNAVVACSINKVFFKKWFNKEVPLPDQHVFGVIGYDGSQVTVRNPWGAGHQGELMTEEGKAVDGSDDGVFDVSLDEFIEYFDWISFEQIPEKK